MPAQDHRCEINSMVGAHGPAMNVCYEQEGHFWVDNGEYASQVNYCPVCGEKAPQPAEPWRPREPTYGWVPDGKGARLWGLRVSTEETTS